MADRRPTAKQRARRAQYRFVADHAIDACRLQHRRITSGEAAARHDLDFYAVALWRLYEIARMVANRCGEERARVASEDFTTELPHLRELRDWWTHPPDPGQLLDGWVSWFDHAVVRLGRGVEYVLDAERGQPAAERLYGELCSVLGDLPDP
ncbi:MAG: hypothetical protein M3276_09380 [Actinomycetota bacterium]|nr:hypothetical protein [Actinomycetota bacterium]